MVRSIALFPAAGRFASSLGYPSAPGEQQGERIEGGTSIRVGPGDVITVAAGVPHQYFIPKGGQITYTLVKIVKH